MTESVKYALRLPVIVGANLRNQKEIEKMKQHCIAIHENDPKSEKLSDKSDTPNIPVHASACFGLMSKM